MPSTQLIILAAGKARYNYFPLEGKTSNTMVPINGKPILWWILQSIKDNNNFMNTYVVIDHEDRRTQNYIEQLNNQRISAIAIENSPDILNSLNAGLSQCNNEFSTAIILGDTLFNEQLITDENVIYVQQVKQASRWCIAQVDNQNNLTNLYDKPTNPITSPYALCGYYHFCDTEQLKNSCTKAIHNKQRELSACILNYNQIHPVKIKKTEHWLDFGNPDKMISSKHQLLQSRSFNQVHINNQTNTITKTSHKISKLENELNWFQSIPTELTIFTPRIINAGLTENNFFIEQEFYGYYTLSELYLYADLDDAYWETILERLLNSYHLFQKHTKPANPEDLIHMYKIKTQKRIQETINLSAFWKDMLHDSNHININNQSFKSFKRLEAWIYNKIESLTRINTFCIIHGDLCFSNILFDLNGHIAKFIDPRGSFGNEHIYGDARYDMAKLRHSIHGKYDFIVNDLFTITSFNESEFIFKFDYERPQIPKVIAIFDQYLSNNQFKLNEIAFLEALLFLTMIPLHADNEQRQLAMYLTSIQLFNELYNHENRD